jgi:hypothetical protein
MGWTFNKDNLDPREKHLIILDDLMDETDQRVASLFNLG